MSLAYLAGFFDGEGCVHIQAKPEYKAFSLMVQISQNNPTVLRLFKKRFKGSLGFYGTSYKYSTSAANAEHLLRTLLPYLKTKRKVAQLALTYRKMVSMRYPGVTSRGNTRPAHLTKKMAKLSKEISRLNQLD